MEVSVKVRVPRVVKIATSTERKLYFDNNSVEDCLYLYVSGGCTSVLLRDQIMKHASELIRQIIMAHNLHKIYPGHEESAFGDLFQTAWLQIERTLYKYKARPHCASCYNLNRPQDSILYNPKADEYGILSPEEVAFRQLTCPTCKKIPEAILYRGTSKVFNMWSQVSRTVILAFIKKENRDHKNYDTYKDHLDRKTTHHSVTIDRFFTEALDLCKHNKNQMAILDALKKIVETDDRPYEGIIGKLSKVSGQSRTQVSSWLKSVRLRSDEFTDSPINQRPKQRMLYAGCTTED